MDSRGAARVVLVLLGTLSMALGIIGIFIPVLPTTPFLLLAAACYARSSERLYKSLLNNRLFGRYIRNYRDGRGIPVRVKILSVAFLWAAISLSAAFAVSEPVCRLIMLTVAAAVTLHIASIRSRRK